MEEAKWQEYPLLLRILTPLWTSSLSKVHLHAVGSRVKKRLKAGTVGPEQSQGSLLNLSFSSSV